MGLFGLVFRTGVGSFGGGGVFEYRVAGVSDCWYSLAFKSFHGVFSRVFLTGFVFLLS